MRLDPADDATAVGVLVVTLAALLHPVVPQPYGMVLYELLTGHPDRQPRELVFVADLTCELRAWLPGAAAAAFTLPSRSARAKARSASARSVRERLGCQPRGR